MTNPNSKNAQVRSGTTLGYLSGSTIVHPEYSYWDKAWKQLRDTFLGEEEMRRQASAYIPMLETMTSDEYNAYVDRAAFYNMVGKTVNGMHGTLFTRPPKLKNVPSRLNDPLKTITRDNRSIHAFAQTVAREVLLMGRYGVLVDREPQGYTNLNDTPYLAGYIAENIVSWTMGLVDGRYELTEVVLREVEARKVDRFGSSVQYYTNFRVLELVWNPDINGDGKGGWTYLQHFFEAGESQTLADINGPPTSSIMPSNRGQPLDRIPFIFFGAVENTPGVDKSPLLDICKINISHYQTTAHLEHGRFFVGLPIYYVQVSAGSEQGEYHLGPSTVWEVETGQKPGVIEFSGHGLGALERALSQKEHQIAALGGRVVGVMTNATAESADLTAMKDRNEKAVLLLITANISDGMTKCLKLLAKWSDVPDSTVSKIEFKMSRDFLFEIGESREFRAIQAMYKDGLLPVDVFYDYMRRSGVISEELEMDEFKKLLEEEQSFPNQLEVQARLEGYPDAKTMWEDENKVEEEANPQVQQMLEDPQVQALRATQPPPTPQQVPAPKAPAPAK